LLRLRRAVEARRVSPMPRGCGEVGIQAAGRAQPLLAQPCAADTRSDPTRVAFDCGLRYEWE
jgi:hypothetical protein